MKLSEANSTPMVERITVPGPWRGDPHLVTVVFPFPVGYECPVSGDVEDRTGLAVVRFSEVSELEMAREVGQTAFCLDWSHMGVYRYDPESHEYELIPETLYP